MKTSIQCILVTLTLTYLPNALGFSSSDKREAEIKEVMSMIEARTRPRLTGLFGIRFGEPFKGKRLYDGEAGCMVGDFTPQKKFLSFSTYQVIIPLHKGNRVAGVVAVADYQSRRVQDEELEQLIQMLERQFQDKFVKFGDAYILKWKQTANLFERISEGASIVITKMPNQTSIIASDDMETISDARQKQKKIASVDASDALFGGSKENDSGLRLEMDSLLKKLFESAEHGDPSAQLNLGVCYELGVYGVKKDISEAIKWYRKAALKNEAQAQLFLGICYISGEGVEKDVSEAMKWYRKAAEQGMADAQYVLGVGYENAEGVEKDMLEAVKWYRKAAEQGHVDAQNDLGACYYNGEGIEKNRVEAEKWFRRAAAQGNERAKKNLRILQSSADD